MPMSSGQTRRQIKLMQDFKPRILACTPSYAMYIAEEMKEMGLDPRKSSWEIGIFGAEPWSEGMRKSIEDSLGLIATDIYGLSEISGPGVSQECTYKEGLHIWSDVFYPEVIDPETNKPVKDGEHGELVITTLTKQAIPLLRYRTRDIVTITHEKCKCGRTAPRTSKITGRTDDMIVVDMAEYQWSDELSVGDPGIDDEHKTLLDLVEKCCARRLAAVRVAMKSDSCSTNWSVTR